VLYTVATLLLKKWQSEAEINARLRDLTRDVRALRSELRSQSAATRPSSPKASAAANPPAQPFEDERKVRLIPKRKRM
jgi:hypothetical protein